MKIDMHAHTIYSDGVDTPERMIARAKAVGLSGIAITDHDSVAGWKRAADAGRKLECVVVPGKEIRVRKGKRVVGEILALFLDADVQKNQVNFLGEIIDEIHANGGIAAIPHPFDFWRKTVLLDIVEENGIKIDALESVNGRSPASSNARGIEYAQTRKLPQTAGSDAHCAKEVGDAYVYCDCDDNIEIFRKEILKGKGRVIGIQKSFTSITATRASCLIRRLTRI